MTLTFPISRKQVAIKDWLNHFLQRWNDWCGDHEMELAIRRHLTAEGYYGSSAKLRGVRLVAVERPGWQQIFRFEADVRVSQEDQDGVKDAQPVRLTLYGLVRDDIRHKIETVRVFHDESERRSLFARWSDGLICLRGAHTLLEMDSSETSET